MTTYREQDVIVVGAGAAGLSAALVLARAQASVLVIDAGEPRNAAAQHIQGYLTRDGMPPDEFVGIGNHEVIRAGGTIVSARVSRIDRTADGRFDVTISDGSTMTAKALIIATGLTDEIPEIPGARERWGTLVHHCPYCHGYEVRGTSIGVIGGFARDLSLKQVGLLRRYSDSVQFITNGIEIGPLERSRLEATGATVIEGTVSALAGEPGALDGIVLDNGATIACDAVFIAPRVRPNDELLRTLGCDVDPETGHIRVDPAGHTSVPGVWAAGNVVTPNAQVISAAGAGSATAIAVNGWIVNAAIEALTATAHNHSTAHNQSNGRIMPTIPSQHSPAAPPSIHARAVITWLAIFPLVTLGFFVIAPFAADWNPVLRAFVLSIAVVPIAVYLVVPQLMRVYGKLRSVQR